MVITDERRAWESAADRDGLMAAVKCGFRAG
jgi:hypothetical protein